MASDRIELVPLSLAFLEALLDERRSRAAEIAGIAIPEGWPDEHDERFLRLRRDQLRREPARAEWIVRAIVLPAAERPMIGHAGFHGPPGINSLRADDAVELGYTVFPEFRGRGYATEAVRGLIAWAESEHGIRRFLASVAPDNVPSLALVRRLGFVEVGSHWDDEDGEELEFELRT